MHCYHDEHGQLPPAVVYGEDGQPLYSWRVLLLPFIEQSELYKQFHLDEPWDSPHNIRLLERMPMTYAPPPGKRSRMPAHHTLCHVFIGKGTAFEEGKALTLGQDFPNGISNTILVIECGPPVPWSKPDDLAFDPEGPLPRIDHIFRDSFRLGMADGSARFVRKDIAESNLRAAIMRNGEEPMGLD